jgi:hypothetical protein
MHVAVKLTSYWTDFDVSAAVPMRKNTRELTDSCAAASLVQPEFE